MEEAFNREKEKFEIEKKNLKTILLQTKLKVVIVGIFIVFEVFFFGGLLVKNDIVELKKDDKSKIAIINFDKEITVKTANDAITLLEKAKKDENVKEILFIMNSPGGSPSASEELSEYLKEINKIKKVNMYVESIAASGGYYIASAIKPLKANKNAVIGSIGVIIQHYNLEELSKKVGVAEDNLAYGEFKQPISLFKNIDDKSKEYLENHLLSPMYKNFVKVIADNRGIKTEEVENVAQGKVFIANDERIKGLLVDEVTSLYKVKEEIKERYKEEVSFVILENNNNTLKEMLKGNLDINLNTNSNILNQIK